MFDGPVIVNTVFYNLNILPANWPLLKLCNAIIWYLRSLEKLVIKMWFEFNFAKKIKGPSFCSGWVKELETSTKHKRNLELKERLINLHSGSVNNSAPFFKNLPGISYLPYALMKFYIYCYLIDLFTLSISEYKRIGRYIDGWVMFLYRVFSQKIFRCWKFFD